MARRGKGPVSPRDVAWIDQVLETGSPVAKKQALQRLCSLLRQGYWLASPKSLKGLILLSLSDADAKVKRWAFNALAQIGEPSDVPFMMTAWTANRSDADVFEAGLTALAKILPKAELLVMLKSSGVDLDPPAVMALGQQSASFAEELGKLRLDIETATEAELRSATLLIGLQKAPETLFSDRHPVSDVLGDLNTHEDPIIAQYSFWATVEHPGLGLQSIRVEPSNFSSLPPNVQGWAYRVLTKDKAVAIKNYQITLEGSASDYREVREGVAIGIREIYYDSLDIEIVDWLRDERDEAIKEIILEHMAYNSDRSSAYREEVESAFRKSAHGSILRSKLEAANRNDKLALEMRAIALKAEQPGLLKYLMESDMGGGGNEFHFHGQTNIGGLSGSGTGASGPVIINSSSEAQAKAIPIAEELLQSLSKADAPSGAEEGAALAKAVIEKPTKGRFEKLVGWLKLAKEGGESFSGIAELAGKAYQNATPLIDWLPDAL